MKTEIFYALILRSRKATNTRPSGGIMVDTAGLRLAARKSVKVQVLPGLKNIFEIRIIFNKTLPTLWHGFV